MGNKYNICSIIRLCFRCCPSAIIFGVTFIVINSINGMKICRPFAHVEKERFKTMNPFIANRNASCPISMIIFVIRVIASGFNVAPCFIFWCFRFAMRAIDCRYNFLSEAAARPCFIFPKVLSGNFNSVPTRAFTFPKDARSFLTRITALFNDCKSPEDFPCKVNKRAFFCLFPSKATARFYKVINKTCSAFNNQGAACAFTKPIRSSFFAFNALYNGKSSKSTTFNINWFHYYTNILRLI